MICISLRHFFVSSKYHQDRLPGNARIPLPHAFFSQSRGDRVRSVTSPPPNWWRQKWGRAPQKCTELWKKGGKNATVKKMPMWGRRSIRVGPSGPLLITIYIFPLLGAHSLPPASQSFFVSSSSCMRRRRMGERRRREMIERRRPVEMGR